MKWKQVFLGSMASFMLSSLLFSPSHSSAADNNNHSGSELNHLVNGQGSIHSGSVGGTVDHTRVSLHAAMVHVAEGESHLAQVRLRGQAQEILGARQSLRASERHYIALLAISSGASVTMIEDLHTSGVSLAQIGYDLRMVKYPTSTLYLNNDNFDMSGMTMESDVVMDHSASVDRFHGDISDHHGVISTPVKRQVEGGGNYQDSYRNNASPVYHNDHNLGGGNSSGMGGMH